MAEAALQSEAEADEHFSPTVRLCEVCRPESGSCGFNLSRTKWDPYPWVSVVDNGSAAQHAGLQVGDCVLEVNGEDVLGQRITEIANRVRARPDRASLLVWNSGAEKECDPEALCCGPMPSTLQRLSACLGAILGALECPVCLDTITPPAHQCANGHLICLGCRARAERCPVCRLRLYRGRSLLADQVFHALTDAFNLREEATREQQTAKLRQRLFGSSKKKSRSARETQDVPELKVSFCAPPANKFLARLMGKSSSLNNLANLAEERPSGVRLSAVPRHLSISSEFGTQLKVKSLSTSEICRPSSPNSARSHTPQRYGSGLLDAGDVPLGSSQRPASYHGSLESLGVCAGAGAGTGSLELLPGPRARDADTHDEKLFRCPWSPSCRLQLPKSRLAAHGRSHGGPLLLAFRTHCALPLPLNGPLCVTIGTRDFFLNTYQTSSANDGDTCVRAWMAASPTECASWKLRVTIHCDSGTSSSSLGVNSLSVEVPDKRENADNAECSQIPHHAHGLEVDIVGADEQTPAAKCSTSITRSVHNGVSPKDKWR